MSQKAKKNSHPTNHHQSSVTTKRIHQAIKETESHSNRKELGIHHSARISYSTGIKMALSSTDNQQRSRKRRALVSSYCCLVLAAIYQTSQLESCSAFSPLFTSASPKASAKSLATSIPKRTILSLAPKTPKKTKKESEEDKNKEEERRKWMSWLSTGKTRNAAEVRLREAEELGGVPRSDRYSAG